MARATVIFHALAREEYRKARRWYTRQSQRAANGFRSAVEQTLERIEDDPLQSPIYRGPARWIKVRRYPYVIYYRMIDEERALIMAVSHTSRRPGYWLRRMRS